MNLLDSLLQMARRLVPAAKIEAALEQALQNGELAASEVDEFRRQYEAVANRARIDDVYRAPAAPGEAEPSDAPMSRPEMERELALREHQKAPIACCGCCLIGRI